MRNLLKILTMIFRRSKIRFGGLWWRQSDLFQHWLITGGTGTGKSCAGVGNLLQQLFLREPRWGGVVLERRPIILSTLVRATARHGRSADLIRLKPRPALEEGNPAWRPSHTINLLGDRRVPWRTHASNVVATAVYAQDELEPNHRVLWKDGTIHTLLTLAMKVLDEAGQSVTLTSVAALLLGESMPGGINPAEVCRVALSDKAAQHTRTDSLLIHLKLNNPPAVQVRDALRAVLARWLDPDLADVFCDPRSDLRPSDLDQGKIIVPELEHGRFWGDSKSICLLLARWYYACAVHRFDEQANCGSLNRLVLLSEDVVLAPTDYTSLEVLAQAKATMIAVCQSARAFGHVHQHGGNIDRVLLSSFSNRMSFRACTEKDASDAAYLTGLTWRKVRTRTVGSNGTQEVTTKKVQTPRVSEHTLRCLQDFECLITRADGRYSLECLDPITPEGTRPTWDRSVRRLFRRWVPVFLRPFHDCPA